jgi:acetolactate synthase-1/2/3 large subunit
MTTHESQSIAVDASRGAQEPETAAEHVIHYLGEQGIDTIFGIPGGHISPFLGALRRQERVKYVIARHEGGAAFMADGYARASGKLGVCLVTAGPGATNALTGLAAAHLDGVPVLLISGQVPTEKWGLGALQESTTESGIDVTAALRHASAHSACIIDPRSFGRQFGRALAVLQGHPAGAVHLSIPANIARAPLERASTSRWPAWTRAPSRPPVRLTSEVRDLYRRLVSARRPLVYIGSGARAALGRLGGSFLEWVESHGIAVVTSLRGKGVFPERSDVSLGVLGLAGSLQAERYLKDGVDALLVIGSRLGEWSSNNFSKDLCASFVAQVDVDATSIGRVVPVDMPIVCDAESILSNLLELAALGPAPGEAAVARLRALSVLRSEVRREFAPEKMRDSSSPLKPQRIMAELDRHMRGELDLYVDMGNCTGWATHCLRIAPPARMFVPCGLSTMGWSCGAVIGGKLARPERRALALLGDGALLMNGTEINTAAKYGVGAVYLVLNDDSLGMVNHGEHLQTGHPLEDDYYALGSPDLVGFARALGANAVAADTAEDLAAALDASFAAAEETRRPQVIVARIDHREVPPYGERFRSVGR